MTEVDLPPGGFDVDLTLDGRWLELPVQQGPVSEDEVSAWATALVADGLAARGSDASPYQRMVFEQLFAASLEEVRSRCDEERQVLLSACLAPGDDVMPVVTVNVSAVSLATGMPPDAVVDLLVLPDEQRYAEPDVEELPTASGVCTRIRQMVVAGSPSPDDGHEAGIATSLLYVWPSPTDGIHLVFDAWFASPVEAALHEPDVDSVARSLTVRAGA